MKIYTVDDFKMEKVYTSAYGSLSIGYNGEANWNVNYSSILTKLIQEAGRWCEYYASDLFIDWKNNVELLMEDADCRGAKLIFGFRQSGVDHLSYVLSHFNNNGSPDYYRAVWVLEIEVDNGEMTMNLGKVNI